MPNFNYLAWLEVCQKNLFVIIRELEDFEGSWLERWRKWVLLGSSNVLNFLSKIWSNEAGEFLMAEYRIPPQNWIYINLVLLFFFIFSCYILFIKKKIFILLFILYYLAFQISDPPHGSFDDNSSFVNCG